MSFRGVAICVREVQKKFKESKVSVVFPEFISQDDEYEGRDIVHQLESEGLVNYVRSPTEIESTFPESV